MRYFNCQQFFGKTFLFIFFLLAALPETFRTRISIKIHNFSAAHIHMQLFTWMRVCVSVCVRGWWANLLNWMASNLRLPEMATETVVVTVEKLMVLIQGSEQSVEGGGEFVGVLIHKTYSVLPACLERSNSASSCSCGCASEVAFNFGPRPRRRCCRTFWCCLPWCWCCCCCWWWCCRRRWPCGRVSSSRRRSTMLACSEL